MIEILDNGEINVKKLTQNELDVLVDLRLSHYKRELEELSKIGDVQQSKEKREDE